MSTLLPSPADDSPAYDKKGEDDKRGDKGKGVEMSEEEKEKIDQKKKDADKKKDEEKKKRIKAREDFIAEWKKNAAEWGDYISSGEAGIKYGVFTMTVMHWKSGKHLLPMKVFVTSVVLLGLCAQIMLPVVYVWYQWEIYQGGFCPSSGTAKTRVAMFAVAALYTAKLSMRLPKQVKEFRDVPGLSNDELPFMFTLSCLDVAWTVVWEGAIYMMNLWVVFLADNVEDMVLNSLAGEFMTTIDDEIVALYLKIFDIDGESYAKANEKKAGCVGWCVFWGAVSSLLVGFFYILVAITLLVFGPMCKP